MTAFLGIGLYVIAGLMVLGTLLIIAAIGKPRKPITPGTGAVLVLMNAAYVVVLILAAGRLS